MFHINTRVILFACIVLCFSSCFRERPEKKRPEKDKYPNILEFSEIINSDTYNSEFEIIKTPYSEFGETQNFYFLKGLSSRDSKDEYITILNKNFEKLKKIKLKSDYTKLAVFDHFILFIEDSNSYKPALSDVIIKRNYPAFDSEFIPFISKPEIIRNSIENSFPDSILNLFSNYINTSGYSHLQYFDSLYCSRMNKELSKDLKEVYEINYPIGGKYYILDYGDKMFYYKDNRGFYPTTCWPDLQHQEKKEFMRYKHENRIDPYDKAFTEWTTNRTVGGKYKTGYQYYKLKLQSKELKFKTHDYYQFKETNYLEAYASKNRDSILLQQYGNGINNGLYWIIERRK